MQLYANTHAPTKTPSVVYSIGIEVAKAESTKPMHTSKPPTITTDRFEYFTPIQVENGPV